MSLPQKADESPESLLAQGRELIFKGKTYRGIMSLAKAVTLAPGNKDYKFAFLTSLYSQNAKYCNETIKEAIGLCLAEDQLLHNLLFQCWFCILREDPGFQALEPLFSCKDYQSFEQTLSLEDTAEALNNPFLTEGLKKIIVRNNDFEKILTYTRRYMLLTLQTHERQKIEEFLLALSIQCFLNEYVFFITEEEEEKISQSMENLDQLEGQEIILLASYQSLHGTQNTEKLIGTLQNIKQNDLDAFIKLNFEAPAHEKKLRDTIKPFGKIKDDVSKKVQQQYEENPYPRWLSFGRKSVDKYKQDMAKNKDILIAGCGTGQQVAMESLAFPLSNITAIDLSRDSLAYAKRKADELGLTNVTFLHGDILEAAAIGKKFEYIACGGVLHHMHSPQEGLASLKDCLASGGVMRISLYSEIARQDIVKVQNWAQEKDFKPTDDGIRKFRKAFFESDKSEIFDQNVILPGDLCTVSECRDLFFHVQEHRFTCLQIQELLDTLDLDLILFAPDNVILRKRYTEFFPDDPNAINLENWHRLEQKNPNIFLGMYTFYTAIRGQYEPGKIPEWLRP